MPDILRFDEINRLNGADSSFNPRAIPFDEYFDVMEIPEEDKERRREFARKLSDELQALFLLALLWQEYGRYDHGRYVREIARAYSSVCEDMGIPLSDYARNHIDEYAEYIATTMEEKLPDGTIPAWNTSEDRADFNGENEANVILNYEDWRDAVEAGYEFKTWNTMHDGRVRAWHAEAEGVTVPINAYFTVGGELGLFPRDAEHFSPDNTINCRCWLTYE